MREQHDLQHDGHHEQHRDPARAHQPPPRGRTWSPTVVVVDVEVDVDVDGVGAWSMRRASWSSWWSWSWSASHDRALARHPPQHHDELERVEVDRGLDVHDDPQPGRLHVDARDASRRRDRAGTRCSARSAVTTLSPTLTCAVASKSETVSSSTARAAPARYRLPDASSRAHRDRRFGVGRARAPSRRRATSSITCPTTPAGATTAMPFSIPASCAAVDRDRRLEVPRIAIDNARGDRRARRCNERASPSSRLSTSSCASAICAWSLLALELGDLRRAATGSRASACRSRSARSTSRRSGARPRSSPARPATRSSCATRPTAPSGPVPPAAAVEGDQRQRRQHHQRQHEAAPIRASRPRHRPRPRSATAGSSSGRP